MVGASLAAEPQTPAPRRVSVQVMPGNNGSRWLPAAAAIAGVAIGALGTYLGNHAILSKQVEREEQTQKAAARGVGRVYAEQLKAAAEVLNYDLARKHWAGRNDLHFFALPTIEDRRLVQARLSSKGSDAVSKADEALAGVASTIEVEAGKPLSPQATVVVSNDERRLSGGVTALRELTL